MMQEYLVHLINGHIIHVWEDMSIPFQQSLICDFADEKGDAFFELEDCGTRYYVPKKNILYISTGEVNKS